MTYIYHALKDLPIGLWPLDGNVLDSSGYDKDGATTGTPTAAQPLAARGIAAQYLDASGFTYPISDVMIATKQAKQFSLEAWIKPHTATATGFVLGRDTSGLLIDTGVLYFRLTSSTETVQVAYPWLEIGTTAHVVGIYDTNDIYLYVNGEVVGSATVPNSIRVSGLTDTTANMKTTATSTFKMTVDSVAVYGYAISGKAILSHYSVGTQYQNVYDISRSNGAHVFVPTSDNASVKLALDIDEAAEWLDASYSNMITSDDQLVNVLDPATSSYLAATWERSIVLVEEPVTLSSGVLRWRASAGVIVSVAINSGAYAVVNSGDQIFTGLNITTASTIKVKIQLPAGVTQSFVKEMHFRAYYSKAITGSDQDILMTLTNPNTITLDTAGYNPVEFSDNAGMKLVSPASISIAADANFGGYNAVEFTIFQSATAISKTLFKSGAASSIPSITTNASGQWVPNNLTALIVDGVVISAATTITLNRWHHVIAIFATQSTALTFADTVNCQLGYIAVYPSGMAALNTAGAQAIYKNWIGQVAIQTLDDDSVNLHEYLFPSSGVAARGYTYDWSIQPAG